MSKCFWRNLSLVLGLFIVFGLIVWKWQSCPSLCKKSEGHTHYQAFVHRPELADQNKGSKGSMASMPSKDETIAAELLKAEVREEKARRRFGRPIEYEIGDKKYEGYVAYDPNIEGPRPAVLIVHEWWGHNDYVRDRAEMLAELGYIAFAVDMYGQDKLAIHPEDAKAFMMEVMSRSDLGQEQFEAGLEQVMMYDITDQDNIAAIGYCFGGATVLNMARQGVRLKGVASFHGSLSTETPAEPGKVKADVMVFHGADDPFVTGEQIKNFKQEMEEANVDYEFVSYPGVKHSFTNPNADKFGQAFDLPLEYNKEADEDSWQKMQEFFDDIFETE